MAVQPSMWYKALKTMPRLSRPQWDGLDLLSRWLVASRSAALVMSLTSAAIGGLLALQMGPVNVWMWLLVAFGLAMAHGANNLLNDYVDHARGVDRGNYFRDQYGPQPLETGFMNRRVLLIYAGVTGFLALAAGAVLGLLTGPLTWVLIAMGAFFLLFYTWPLKYIALGELSLLLVWGPLMIGGTYYVLAGEWSWRAVIASLPYALGVSATLIGKHLDKMDMDREKKVYTLPVLIGCAAARAVALVMFALMFAVLLFLMAIRYFTPVLLLPFLSLFYFFRYLLPMFRAPRPKERPASYPEQAWPLWYVASSFVFTRRFGGWFLIALVADALLQRWVFPWW